MNIGIDSPLGAVILTTEEYRELVETRLVAIAAGEDMMSKISRLKENLQKANTNLAVSCVNTDALKTEIEDQKKTSDFWYSEYMKVKGEMQDLKDQLAALGGREETP